MLRRGSAASSQHICSGLCQCTHLLRKYLRSHVIYRLSIYKLRQPGIWFGNDRQSRIPAHLPDHRHHLVRSCRAVDTNGIDPHRRHHKSRRLRICSKQRSSILCKSQCHHHRHFRDFLHCQYRRPALLQAHHGLHHDKIHTCLHQIPGLFLIDVHQLFEWQTSHRI